MLKIRLRRMGARHSPFYRVVVSDSRNVPTASAVEELGHYDPTANPARVTLDAERIDHWLARGARMSPTVKRLLGQVRKQGAAATTKTAETTQRRGTRERAEAAAAPAAPATAESNA
jgi:small subunit ribosomal protein S16